MKGEEELSTLKIVVNRCNIRFGASVQCGGFNSRVMFAGRSMVKSMRG